MKFKQIIFIFSLLLGFTCPKDELTRLEIRSKFKKKDFVFDLDKATPAKGNSGGEIRVVTVNDMPALQGEGVSFQLFTLKPCSANLPHTHPRATELLYVISASRLQLGFVEENTGRGAFINTIKTGQVTVFPRGLIHFQLNLGCKPAHYISGLNNEDPGVITISQLTFMLPDQVLEIAFGLRKARVNSIRSRLPGTPSKGIRECLRRCGIRSETPSQEEGEEEVQKEGYK